MLLLIWTLALLLASPMALFYKFIWITDKALGIKPYCTTFNPTFTLTFLMVRKTASTYFIYETAEKGSPAQSCSVSKENN